MGYKLSHFLIVPLRSFSVSPHFICRESDVNVPDVKIIK